MNIITVPEKQKGRMIVPGLSNLKNLFRKWFWR